MTNKTKNEADAEESRRPESMKSSVGGMVPRQRLTEDSARVRDQYLTRRIAWRQQQWKSQQADPNLNSVQRQKLGQRLSAPDLANQGVDFHLTSDYPAGARPEDVQNYPEIVRAFSRTFGPNLFEEL